MNENDYENFLQRHQFQLALSQIPKHLYRRLYEKMKNETFDSGSYFQLCPVDDDDDEMVEYFNPERRYYVSTLEDTVLDPEQDENAIFLIDHAWTYRIKDARTNLQQIPNLYERMASLMNVASENKEDGIELILQRMWKYNQTYTLTSSQLDPQRDCEEAYEPYWSVKFDIENEINRNLTFLSGTLWMNWVHRFVILIRMQMFVVHRFSSSQHKRCSPFSIQSNGSINPILKSFGIFSMTIKRHWIDIFDYCPGNV